MTIALRRSLPFLAVGVASLAVGCFDYDDTSDQPDDSVDVVEDTGTADTSADVAIDTDEDAGPTDPFAEFERVACSTLTPEDATSDGAIWAPPGCGYEVTHHAGVQGILDTCGEASEPPRGLHLTYPHEDASRYMAVSWTTPITTRESMVLFGTSPDNLDTLATGHSFTYEGLDERVVHEVHLCGLQPNTTYYYQAGGQGAWSDVYSFATAPGPEDDGEIVFAVTGDTRSDTFELWGSAVEQMRELGAEFIVFSGDAVDKGQTQEQWDIFFDQGQPGMAEMPFVPANGNHDLLLVNYISLFALPHGEANYSILYGPLHFMSMTDFDLYDPRALPGPYRDFLEAKLDEHQDSPWSFMVNHRPFYSASTRHGRTADLERYWEPLIDQYEVDMVFNGHDHNYERSKPIRNGEAVTNVNDGTVYTVVAGVGAPLYDNGEQWWTEVSEKTESFAIIRVSGDRLEFTAYRLDGTKLDELVIQR